MRDSRDGSGGFIRARTSARRRTSALVATALVVSLISVTPSPAAAGDGTGDRDVHRSRQADAAAQQRLEFLRSHVGERDGTLDRLLHYDGPTTYRAGSFGCAEKTAPLPHVHSTAHFQLRYGTINRLTAAAYGTALEQAYAKEVTSYKWAKPPVIPSRHLPGNRYQVRVERQSGTTLGFTYFRGAYAGRVGDNPATPWHETTAQASCMSLSNNFSTSLLMRATAAHEFAHMIQYGLGALNSDVFPDGNFVEGTASWMEDEVVDAANDIDDYLWPSLLQSMGAYPETNADEYAYWLVFRGLTERYGTGAPGLGEDIMQRMWEASSRGKEELDAMAEGMSVKGAKLGVAFHDVAVAARFSKQCGGMFVYPNCFEEGTRYKQAASIPLPIGSVDIDNAYDGSIRDDYSAQSVKLPQGHPFLWVTVKSQQQGVLRASVDCTTPTTIKQFGFATEIKAGQERSTIADLRKCVGPAFVIVSNEHVVDPDPTTSTQQDYLVTVRAPASFDGTFTWAYQTDYANTSPPISETKTTHNDGSASLHLVPDPDAPFNVLEDNGTSSFSYQYRLDDSYTYSNQQVTCHDTTVETGAASGVFSTYESNGSPAFIRTTLLNDLNDPPELGPWTHGIGVTIGIPFVATIHSEGSGTDETCDFEFDDTRDDQGPFADFFQFRCIPDNTMSEPFQDLFMGTWNDNQQTFSFQCETTEMSSDGHTSGSLTVSGQLVAS